MNQSMMFNVTGPVAAAEIEERPQPKLGSRAASALGMTHELKP
jgi:hypothetical protein